MQLELGRVPLPLAGLKHTLLRKLQLLSVSTAPGSRGIDSARAELWSALEETGVQLPPLSVAGSESAMDEMFAYLLSYTGLRELAILAIQFDRQDQEEIAGSRLWQRIVPHHKDTLTALAVVPCYEGVCCY